MKAIVPGSLDVIEVQYAEGSFEFNCERNLQVNDVVEVRIADPAVPVRVHDLRVEAEADAVLAGVVKTSEPKKMGSDRISIFVGLRDLARSGVIVFAYKHWDEKAFSGRVVVHVTKHEA